MQLASFSLFRIPAVGDVANNCQDGFSVAAAGNDTSFVPACLAIQLQRILKPGFLRWIRPRSQPRPIGHKLLAAGTRGLIFQGADLLNQQLRTVAGPCFDETSFAGRQENQVRDGSCRIA